MKFTFTILLIIPCTLFAQTAFQKAAKKIGPNPIFIIDSNRVIKAEFIKIKPTDVASLTLLTDSDAISEYGTDATDGVVIAKTKPFAKRQYIRFFRSVSPIYDSVYSSTKTDTTFQYIINDKIKTKNDIWDLSYIDNKLFISLEIIDVDDLKNKYNILDKSIGILVRCRKPDNVTHADEKF